VLSGTGGLTKSGTGTLVVSGVNTYTGATTIAAGTLRLGTANRIADASAVSVSASGTTFDLNGFSETIGSLAGAGNVTLGAGTLTLGGNNTTTAFSGVISGTGALVKFGTGTMTLTGGQHPEWSANAQRRDPRAIRRRRHSH
jgi:autotransporter-associated beta strand protein